MTSRFPTTKELVLSGISPRVALVLPVVPPRFTPTDAPWRSLASDLGEDRRRVHVFGFLSTHGIVPEDTLYAHPVYFRESHIEDEEVSYLQGAARARTWLDLNGPLYQKIVLVRAGGPIMRSWSEAARGSFVAPRIFIEKPPSEGNGLSSPHFRQRVKRRLGVA